MADRVPKKSKKKAKPPPKKLTSGLAKRSQVAPKAGKAGRPRIEFTDSLTLEEIRDFTSTGATLEDLALRLGCHVSTLYRRKKDDGDFARALMAGHSTLRIALRRRQVEVAMAGDPGMLRWLGMQLLDQSAKKEVDTKLTGIVGGGVIVVPAQLTAEEWNEMAKRYTEFPEPPLEIEGGVVEEDEDGTD